MIEIYNNDCFDVFPEIEDNSIDLFVLDLPYANKKFGNCTACAWDTPIDLEKMWVEIKRMMKPSAIIVFFCNTKFGYALIHSNPKWFKYDLIWEKSRKVGFLSANKQPLRKHENIYIFKNEVGTYNPQKVEGKPYTATRKDCDLYSKDIEHKPTINTGDRHPTSILPEFEKTHENLYIFKDEQGTYNPQKTEGHKPRIRSHNKNADCNIVYGDNVKIQPEDTTDKRHPTSIIPEFEKTILKFNNPHKTIHRTQKPVDLCEWLIKTYSNENDTVMDFTMGSGTVGEACQNTNRKFIGIERDPDIFKLAEDRLKKNEEE
jgi:DNA modification methylase